MTDEEVNETIAEFMGWRREQAHPDENVDYWWISHDNRVVISPNFTKSLDSLVPVWEKLRKNSLGKYKSQEISFLIIDGYICSMKMPWGWSDGDSFQQAAAHATAIAIQELK